MMTSHCCGRLLLLTAIFSCLLGTADFNIQERQIYEAQPRIITQDGHLIFQTAENHNITLRTRGFRAAINVNDENLGSITVMAKNASEEVRRMKTNEFAQIRQQIQQLTNQMSDLQGTSERLNTLEQSMELLNSRGTNQNSDGRVNDMISQLTSRVTTLESQVQTLRSLLSQNECASNPCRNGGTCVDTYNGFLCQCPDNWEGVLCDMDVNECARFIGTELGCQNGATCINRPGSYECHCPSNWYGVHCTQKDDCSSGSAQELCGHGVCVNQQSASRGITCICDQGWSRSSTGACTEDVDECTSMQPACSQSPAVACINVPGSFYCGACPQGYTGNGYYCTDINECLINNGGCSLSPRVQCINTQGSRTCGRCPAGYEGNGVTCTYRGVCHINNGGCHPMAVCVNNPAIGPSYVQCICPQGYSGSGIGMSGCVPGQQGGGGTVLPVNPCINNPCVHGTCMPTGNTYICRCQPGYEGPSCESETDNCASSPCQNEGVCVSHLGGYTCQCTPDFTGDNCETEQQSCGGTFTSPEGSIRFPHDASEVYPHNWRCVYQLRTESTKVLNVTFDSFHLEGGGGHCPYDWLQIHDGWRATSHLIGRFCGTNTPGGGNIVSTHNSLYMKFRSDHSVAGQGFEFHWNSIDAVCGDTISGSHGSINSPGYPGNYPHNRDCYWTVSVPLGKRVQFHFATLQLEHHDNCSFDFLQIRDGSRETDPALQTFCSSANPSPLTTSGPYAWIHFHSDGSVSDTGFHITYAAVQGIPGCGGLLTSPSGTFRSPGHPDTYENSLDCEWLIRVRPTDRISLSFQSFSLEHHYNCYYDYVEVYEGNSPDGGLVGRYCGYTIPLPYQSLGNTLFIKFHSDTIITDVGFQATYETICGGMSSEPSGILHSPYHPLAYPSNRRCIYLISQPPGTAIRLEFQSFDIEGSTNCIYDYLEVRDGDSEDSEVIGKYCGGTDLTPEPIISSYNYLWLEFKTDGSVQNTGFWANYTTTDVTCGGILKETHGIISSPSDPQDYPGEMTCNWIIRANPGNVIRVTWLSFALRQAYNCWGEYVAVYDNSTLLNTDGLIGKYCGSNLPPIITSIENVMTIKFWSTHGVTTDGFTASYIALNSTSACGGNYFTVTGVIRSPNFPNNYPHQRDCEWVINVPSGQQIMLNITDFEVEYHEHCVYDSLEIRNGGYAQSPLIGTYCGTTIPSLIPSHSNQMYLRFTSDEVSSARGFQIFWDGTTTGCGGIMMSPTGSFSSPNYPQDVGMQVECFWRISVNQGSVIQLHLIDVDMDSGSDCYAGYLEVFDGSSSLAPSLGKYCNPVTEFITSSGNTMYVKFQFLYSVEGQNARGFHAMYQTLCNTRVTGYSGVIESPNFPDPYPHNRDCTWVIEVPRGNAINVTFSHFEVEDHWNGTCNYDFLELLEGEYNEDATTRLGKWCGWTVPPPVSSTKNQLYVHFVSDISVAHNGFRLEWVANVCGGRLTKLSGNFSSPNYPGVYPVNTACEWYITVGLGSSIQLTVAGFDMESSRNCQYDSLKIYGGPDINSPLLTQLCHKQDKDVIITSMGNNMFVRFVSDVNIRGRGFSASYVTIPTGCGGRNTAPSGVILSPNYPRDYDANDDCSWVIEVAQNHVVQLEFTDFDVEPHSNCSYDHVAVYDGDGLSSPLLMVHCGNSLPSPAVVRSTGNKMYVRLKADGSVHAKGFKANYSTGCGARIVTEESGELTSPNFPHLYSARLNCTWIITGSNPDDRVTLTFTHLEMHNALPNTPQNCTYDYVQVRDGDDQDAPLFGTFCRTRVPPAITSQGSAIFVHLISRYGAGAGFRAVYSVESAACGGNYTSEHGTFASPGFPNSYPENTECVWEIRASPGNRVTISFRQFDIETDEYCNLDYVEVHENSATGRLIGHFCGDDIPTNLTAANRLWVKFRSNGAITGNGFLADYSLLHGNELTGDSGVITSPMYPIVFLHPGVFTWRVTVSLYSHVAITFQEFQLEKYPGSDGCLSDVVIYDGYDDQAPELLRECGFIPPPTVTSVSNVVFIKLRSNTYYEGSLFHLTWLAVSELPPPTLQPQTTEAPTCGGQVFLSHLNYTMLSTPGYPDSYENNQYCEWLLETDVHSKIKLIIVDVQIEESPQCSYDYLRVFDGSQGEPNWQELGTYCQRVTSDYVIHESSGRLMRVVFYSDVTVTRAGVLFRAYTVCGGYQTSPTGMIQTPGYPSLYPSNEHCEWVIKVRPGRKIALQFDDFNVAQADGACDDFVAFRNGLSSHSPFLGNGQYCGTTIPSLPETSSNKLYVGFVSNENINTQGFKLHYHEVSLACGGNLQLTHEEAEVTITSPNHPDIPPAHTECEWVVLAPAGERIQMDFETLDVTSSQQCSEAGVQVRDGGTIVSDLLGQYCQDKPGSIFTTDNAIYVRFYTNSTLPKTGYKAKLKIATCGGTIIGSTGIVTSPNFPNAYDNNLECEWHVKGPLGHYLTFQFLDMDLPDMYNCSTGDHVEIKEKNATEEILGTFCGSTVPASVDSYANEVVVIFRTDSDRWEVSHDEGFRLQFTASAEECGGSRQTPSGMIQSPGYPNSYPHRRYCKWEIRGPIDRKIKLEFLDFDLESPSIYRQWDVCRDYVAVANGIGRTSVSVIQRHCGSTIPDPIESTSNSMTVFFRSWGGSSHRGFKARWTSDQQADCGGLLQGESGYIVSPGFDSGNYTNSMVCDWRYTSPSNQRVTIILQPLVFSLENMIDFRCVDALLVRGGPDLSSNPVAERCGNDTSPILSPYPQLSLQFKTDESVVDRGFNISYSISHCGGVFPDPSNTITSPNYPSNYNANMHCVWLLDYPEGDVIQVTFTSFNIADEGSCQHDYVILRNGRLGTSPVLSRTCGNTLPPQIQSQSNHLWIEFHSDGSNQASGFSLTANAVAAGCGGILHGQTGNFSSPGFPEDYANNIECEWEVRVDPGYSVRLNFVQSFDLETSNNCSSDVVQVWYYRMGGWGTLGRYCGKQTPAQVKSNSNRIKVLFRTNDALVGGGFMVNWTSECGSVFTEAEGIFTSPGYPDSYRNFLNCNYQIVTLPENYVLLEFQDFQVEEHPLCQYDWVDVYQGNTTDSQRLGHYCGTEIPPPLPVAGTTMVQFKTDLSVTMRGWRATYKIQQCGGHLTEPGRIQTPSHPMRYQNNMNCTWVIQAPSNKAVSLKFEYLQLEHHRQCEFDYVAVYDGGQILDNKLLGKFCGDLGDVSIIKSASSSMVVQFKTDHSITSGGFQAVVIFTYGPLQGCGGLLNVTSTPQTVRSLDMDDDGNYEPFLHCDWLVTGEASNVIQLQFNSFDIQPGNSTTTCDYDYLEVRDGHGPHSPIINRYCGSTTPDTVVASGNFMWISFFSDSVINRAGFVATVTSTESQCGPAAVFNVTNITQTLTSPSYPSAYPVNLRCRWSLYTSGWYSKQLHFVDFDVEESDNCENDYVDIHLVMPYRSRNSAATSQTVFRGTQWQPFHPMKYCGSAIPHDIYFSSNTVQITFVSNGGNTGRGFKIEYGESSCNRDYTSPYGRILSQYTRRVENCTFTIQVERNRRISVYFSYFSIWNAGSDCSDSYLMVRDGNNSSSPLLANLCGRTIPSSIYSSGSSLWFHYIETTFTRHRFRDNFDITYISTTSEQLGCGGTAFDTVGSITSPGYPGNYSQPSSCIWNIRVPVGQVVTLWFNELLFGPAQNCTTDYLELYEVENIETNTQTLYSRYCGDDQPARYNGATNAVSIKYVTSIHNTGPGWRIKFSAVHPTNIPN